MSAMNRLSASDESFPRPKPWVVICVLLVLIIIAIIIELHVRGIEHPPLPGLHGSLHPYLHCS
jgi:hypothetical protein